MWASSAARGAVRAAAAAKPVHTHSHTARGLSTSRIASTTIDDVSFDGVKAVFVSYIDLFGKERAKLVPTSAIHSANKNGAGFAGFAAHFNLVPSDPDLIAIPDFSSFVRLPWRPEIGWVASNLFIGGAPFQQSPRLALQRQLDLLAEDDMSFKTGVECEFMLLDPSGKEMGDKMDLSRKPCYDQQAFMRSYDVIQETITYMEDLGWEPYQADHEDANGQFEINWKFADAMTTADRHTFFKFMIRCVAEKHGLRATMMPKPFVDKTGNGCHMHLSLHSLSDPKERNLFKDADGGDEFMLSEMSQHFTGGLLEHVRALTAIGCPTVNSYKRLSVNMQATDSGATWAPTVASHGGNDRTHVIRIPDFPRVEFRLPDMAANPYLTPAALLAAGMDGVSNKTDPGPRAKVPAKQLDQTMHRELPTNLLDAIRDLEADTKLRSCLGEEVVDSFAMLRRQQWSEYTASMSQWELDTQLDA